MPVALDAGLGPRFDRWFHARRRAFGAGARIRIRAVAFFGSHRCGRTLRSRSMDPNAHPGRYRVSLHRAKGSWFAHVLDVPGCIGRGATEVEAVEDARAVIRSYRHVAHLLAHDTARIILEVNA